MAARARYPSTHEQLLDLAIRALGEGLPFVAFWDRAVRPGRAPVTWGTDRDRRPYGCVIWPRDTVDRNLSREVTMSAAVRQCWERAYLGLAPTRGDLAIQALAPALVALAEQELELAV